VQSFELWIRPLHFLPGLVSGEHPLDACGAAVSAFFPGCDFCDQFLTACDAPIKALTAQDPDLDLNHVEPACMFWGVVKLQAAQHASGFSRGKGVVEGSCAVGRQIVEHDPDLRGFSEVDVRELAHAGCEVHSGAPIGDLHRAPWPMRIEKDEEIDRAVAPVLEIEALKPSLC